MKRTRGLLAVLALLACSNFDLEELPTEVTLLADKTSGVVGEEFEFTWEATGAFMAGVVLDFGDGSARDSTATPGAQRASATRTHTFMEPGSYTVTATVEDVDDRTDTDSEVIQITGG